VGSVQLSGQAIDIGRSDDCAIALPSTGVSRQHASAYMQEDGSVVITDEGSANGVKVNSQLITGPTLIDQTSRVDISEFVLRLEPAPAAPPPIADTQPTAPVPPPPHGTLMEPEEMYTMLEAHEGAAQALAASVIQLKGRGGPYDGTVFSLDKALLTVGRTDENDIVVDDPSVSRRHAQLRLAIQGDRFTVLDLRSSNGTFVDGERIKRTECGEDSVVRFGDLAFQVTMARQQDQRPKRKMTHRTLYIIAGTVFALLCAVAVVAYIKRPKPPEPVKITPEERLRQLQAEVQQFVDEGQRRITLKEWSTAIAALDKALAKDPLNSECKKLRAQALQELEYEKVFEQGQQFYSLGNQENYIKAKEIFLKIPDTSIYFRDVRYKIQAINMRLAESYRVEGVSRCKAKYWRHCHKALCQFFELVPEDQAMPGEAGLRRTLQSVEQRLKRKRDFTPCTAVRFLKPLALVAAASPEKLLSEKYAHAAVRGVLLQYFQGRVDMALKTLSVLRRKRNMRPQEITMREIDRQLLIIRGKYQEGFSALRDRNVDAAQKHWDLVLAADKALLPLKMESFYRREIINSLGNLYFELGDEQFNLSRFRLAFKFWSRGRKASPKHAKVLNGVLQLEKEAEGLLRKGKEASAAGNISEARAKFTLAREITEPGQPLHEEATKALTELGS